MLTVDFDRLGLRPGDRVLDMGCGAGRHAFEMYKRGADVIAFDQDADDLATVREWFTAMRDAGEVPAGAEADVKEGDALQLPFADAEFDRVVAAEVLEHIPGDIQAIHELARVLRPGGPTTAPPATRWSSPAATTPTACTRRTGGSSARSGSATTTTRWPGRTTDSWSGRS